MRCARIHGWVPRTVRLRETQGAQSVPPEKCCALCSPDVGDLVRQWAKSATHRRGQSGAHGVGAAVSVACLHKTSPTILTPTPHRRKALTEPGFGLY